MQQNSGLHAEHCQKGVKICCKSRKMLEKRRESNEKHEPCGKIKRVGKYDSVIINVVSNRDVKADRNDAHNLCGKDFVPGGRQNRREMVQMVSSLYSH